METKEQALEWVKSFLHEVDTQDNRCTAKPIMFFLQTKNEYVAHDEYYGSNTRTVFRHPRMEGDTCDSHDEAVAWIKEWYEDESRVEAEIEKIEEFQMGHHWETQEAFFTESGVKRHLDLNKHNYRNGHRDFVIHAFRNPEIEELFKALRILALNAKES